MNIRELPLTNSSIKALIDEEDYPRVCWLNWFLSPDGYVVANYHSRQIYLHRLIMGNPVKNVDHEDRIKHHNYKSNLRLATHSQNHANSGPKRGRRLKGVYRTTDGKRFRASICVNRKQISLGQYDTELEATLVYNKAALAAWGKFAYLNPVPNEHP